MSEAGTLADLAHREVVAMHEFFVAWYRGEDGPRADFDVCAAAFAPDFRMVTPAGVIHDRLAVLEGLRRNRGSRAGDFRIEISGVEALWQRADAVLLGYVERQYRDGRTTQRRSTAMLTPEASAPRGVVWRHLQETWMQVAG
jgi:hypothetical protein